MDEIKHILLATDGSQGALRAAALTGLLARGCNADIGIVVVHSENALVLPAMTSAVLPGSVPFTPFPKKDAKKRIEKAAAKTTLPDTERALGEAPGLVEHVQLWGHVAEKICQYATHNDIDLIVVGRRGKSAFENLLLGGVSSQVINHAPCPVTVAC